MDKGFALPSESSIKSLTNLKNILSEKEHGFTLIEIIVVIIIVGILAAVGLTQYSTIVEKGRVSEAITRLGTMRQLAYQYYLENGTLTTMTQSDVGMDNTCASGSFYRYFLGEPSKDLYATRCTSNGKTPNASRQYTFKWGWIGTAGSGPGVWQCCYSDDSSPCFGYPVGSYCGG